MIMNFIIATYYLTFFLCLLNLLALSDTHVINNSTVMEKSSSLNDKTKITEISMKTTTKRRRFFKLKSNKHTPAKFVPWLLNKESGGNENKPKIENKPKLEKPGFSIKYTNKKSKTTKKICCKCGNRILSVDNSAEKKKSNENSLHKQEMSSMHLNYRVDKKRSAENEDAFTAKDVAALEVIVDLMKNTAGLEEKGAVSNNLILGQSVKPGQQTQDTTNSIQVHIAIPYDIQQGKKRSALEPLRVRKVFSARMATPVDLEYQVHSFEDSPETTATVLNTDDGLSPGVYFLVDKANNGYALKPVKAKIDLSDIRSRQAVTMPLEFYREETTRLEDIKNIAKVTLSKNFIAAVNKQLIDLYENLTKPNNDDIRSKRKRSMNPATAYYSRRKTRRTKDNDSDTVNNSLYRIRRVIDWNVIHSYFGGDRVCKCNCKPYKPMCRACAASDAVINELIFEFDNIEKYMKDHCTEIQTYFWMNPSGGLQLRDTVHSIDKSLNDYYKRVKGKCQGKTCKTFGTTIDKRQFIKSAIVKEQNNVKQVMDDLVYIADDLNKTVKISTYFNHKLNDEGYKMLQAINNCIPLKDFKKRSGPLTTVKKLIKNVYSLDNISVNIICNPDIHTTKSFVRTGFTNSSSTISTTRSTSSTISTTTATPTTSTSTIIPTASKVITNQKTQDPESLFEFDFDDDHEKPKKRKGFKSLFPRRNKKDKLFTYFTRQDYITLKPLIKRDTYSQIEIPIISDSGGTFWFDYLQATSTDEPRTARHTQLKIASPKLGISVVQSKFVTSKQSEIKHNPTINYKMNHSKITTPINKDHEKKKPDTKLDNTSLTVDTNTLLVQSQQETDPEMVSEYLADDISQLLQIFGSVQDVETMNMLPNRSQILKSTSKQTVTMKTTKSNITNAEFLHKPKNATANACPDRKITSLIKNATKNMSINNSSKYSKKLKSTSLTTAITKTTPLTPQNTEKKVPVVHRNNITDCQNKSTLFTQKPRTTKQRESIFWKNKKNTHKHTKNTSKVNKLLTPPNDTNSSIKSKSLTISTPMTDKKDNTITTRNTSESLNNKTIDIYFTDLSNKGTQETYRTTHKHGFFGKIKTATLRFLGFTKFKSAEATTKTVQRSHYTTSLTDKISDTKLKLFKMDELNQGHEGHENANIVNEYDNQLAGDVSNEHNKKSNINKNLLMSIIEYEAHKLNEEWQRVANDNDEHSGDGYKGTNRIRSANNDDAALRGTKDLFKETNCKKTILNKDMKIDIIQDIKNIAKIPELQIPDPTEKEKCELKNSRKKPTGLLNKIVSKMGVKIVSYKKNMEKTVTQSYHGEVAGNSRITTAMNVERNINIPEASDTYRSSNIICDLQATYNHILDLHNILDKNKFETFVENIPCYRYKRISRTFFINYNTDGLKWNWIRNKRSIMRRAKFKNDARNYSDGYETREYFDTFETFVKDEDGIYRPVTRRKRNSDGKSLRLKNLPSLLPTMNEVYSMLGDSITLECLLHDEIWTSYSQIQCTWDAEDEIMLKHNNVQVDGTNLLITQVGPKNSGSYRCIVDNIVRRSVKLNVVTLPVIDVVFLPTYRLPRDCAYDDLKAIEQLSGEMSNQIHCGKVCSIRIDEPICQRDVLKLTRLVMTNTFSQATNRSLVRPTAVLTVSPLRVKCSVQCRRDLQNSLVRLSVSNVPTLKQTTVVICKDGVNETLTPDRAADNSMITHKLRKKDSSGHHEYNKLSSLTDSDEIHVIILCDAGYYLMHDQTVCAPCPSNTSSSVGDNRCTPCPGGTKSELGAAKCLKGHKLHRRYDWWWYPPCGYLVACTTVVCVCGVCVAFSLLVQLISRRVELRDDVFSCTSQRKDAGNTVSPVHGKIRSSRTRPLSPSRVILARFFKPSLTSSRATPVDSQETRFELWKERNRPPPLPPIDFDLDTS